MENPIEHPLFPHITVQLTGQNGNAMNLIGITRRAMRRGGVSREDIELFSKEATSGDYDHVLITCMRTVDVT